MSHALSSHESVKGRHQVWLLKNKLFIDMIDPVDLIWIRDLTELL